jgi:hypothetical protein
MSNSYHSSIAKNLIYILSNKSLFNKEYDSFNDYLSLTELTEIFSQVTNKKIT